MRSSPVDRLTRSLQRSLYALMGVIGLALLLVVLLFFELNKAPSPASPPSTASTKLAASAVPRDTNFVNLWTAPSDWRMFRFRNRN